MSIDFNLKNVKMISFKVKLRLIISLDDIVNTADAGSINVSSRSRDIL